MFTKRQLLGGAALAASAAISGLSPARAAAPSRAGFFAAKDIAEAGFIFGLPIVMNYGVMYDFVINKNSGQYKAPFNTIYNEARVFTYKDTVIPTPNSDTPYSMLWLDLRSEPMVISVPAIDRQRYYSVQLCDGNTYNYGYIGTHATGSDAGDYMVVGPDWNGPTPSGIKKMFRSGTQFSLAIFRTQLFGPPDLGNVKNVQAGYSAQRLSAYLKQPAPPAAPAGRCSHEPCRAGGGASGDADDDWIDREAHHGAASLERGEPAVGDHPRNWCYRGHRDRSDRPGSEGFSIGS
jgi:hypothetical protein